MHALTADFTKLRSLLHESWCEAIDPGNEVAVDESLFAFLSTDPTSPHRFYPRKPHKTGLVIFSASFKLLNGVSYLFDFVPDVNASQPVNPRHALQAIAHRFPWDWSSLHVTIDAGFSGEANFGILRDLGVFYTASVNINHKPWLYELLTTHCPPDGWIAAFDQQGDLWSVKHSSQNQQKGYMFLTSNAYIPPHPPVQDSDLIVGEAQVKILGKLDRRALIAMAIEMGITLTEISGSPELAIAGRINSHSKARRVSGHSYPPRRSQHPLQNPSISASIPTHHLSSESPTISSHLSPTSHDPVSISSSFHALPSSSQAVHIFFESEDEGDLQEEPRLASNRESQATPSDRCTTPKEMEKEIYPQGSNRKGAGEGQSEEKKGKDGEVSEEEEEGREDGDDDDDHEEEEMENQTTTRTYTKDELEAMKGRDIKEILEGKGLGKGGRKSDQIQRIINNQDVNEEDVRNVLENLRRSGREGEALHHKYYRRNFNSVDLHDGYFYSLQGKHRINQWKAKFVVSLLEVGLINAFALGKRGKRDTISKFRDDLTNRVLEKHVIWE